ncbi:MAG: prenyltransferase/squalene oxidase repeat-containing protein [Clostridium cadaveris]|uniref:prenyltransferase/squalene oxidase repeat-containing protein n=1 Tax=Clostridium cadaveris TaxID=1529 RepID=UPI002A8D51FD|nr:prenyltransferase/squalene oxidase repeat-containing protein [Clostridium cadaveris]
MDKDKITIRYGENKSMKRLINKTAVLILTAIFILSSVPVYAYAQHKDYTLSNLEETIIGIVDWKKSEGSGKNKSLFNKKVISEAGNGSADWYAVGLGRMGYDDDYFSYLAMLKNFIQQRYSTEDKLDAQKATEWHRISLAILSLGGDPTDAAVDKDGKHINLIADGTYNRGNTESLGSQGINGYIWGLITLDAMRYTVPENSADTRDSIIQKVLENQQSSGAFSLNGDDADVDITAMALTALAPYYNSEQSYFVHESNLTVRDSADKAVEYLSKAQGDDGGFTSWGIKNCESSAQVMVALCSLGIDPVNDERFIKNGNNILDGLMQYKVDNGGFTHSYDEDKDNPSASPGKANSMASEQALYSLVSLYRFQTNLRSLFDFRPEMTKAQKEQIEKLEDNIDAMSEDYGSVQKLFEEYLRIPVTERCYVKNYWKLANSIKKMGIKNTSEYLSSAMNENTSQKGTVINIFKQQAVKLNLIFNENDLEEYKSLPDKMGTEYYGTVIRLIEKLEASKNNEEYKSILDDLINKKSQIEEVQHEIEDINAFILESLYPFENIGYKDKDKIDSILYRIDKLDENDRSLVLGYEDVLRGKTQITTQIRSVIIGALVTLVAAILIAILVLRFKKKRKCKKEQLMIDENNDNDDW